MDLKKLKFNLNFFLFAFCMFLLLMHCTVVLRENLSLFVLSLSVCVTMM